MNIGMLGAGNMGGALGKIWAQSGHDVLFSYSRDEQKLQKLAEEAGPHARTGTPLEAAQFGDVVFVSVQPDVLADALGQAGTLAGKVLITCVSGLRPDFQGFTMGIPTQRKDSVAEEIAALVPDARVVEAFNLTFAELLKAPTREFGSERATIPYCGDEVVAKETTATLIQDAGFEPLDIGPLIKARSLETLATTWVQFAATTGMFPGSGIKILRQ
jgi:predicted dinucleotide-binding enzyme